MEFSLKDSTTNVKKSNSLSQELNLTLGALMRLINIKNISHE